MSSISIPETRLAYTRQEYYESPKLTKSGRVYVATAYTLNANRFNEDFTATPALDPYALGIKDGFERTQDLIMQAGTHWSTRRYAPTNWFYLERGDLDVSWARNDYAADMADQIMYYSSGGWPAPYQTRYTKDESEGHTGRPAIEGGFHVGLGQGRVYNGTTIWWAVEILETVADMVGVPGEKLEPSDYEELAAHLYDLSVRKYPALERNRLLDFEHTELVLSQLQNVFGEDVLEPRIVATVHDILRYYPRFERFFGREWSIWTGLEGNAERSNYWDRRIRNIARYDGSMADSTLTSHQENLLDISINGTQRTITPVLGCTYTAYRQLSNRMQLDHHASISMTAEQSGYSEEERVISHYADIRHGISRRDTTQRETPLQKVWENLAVVLSYDINYLYIITSRKYWEVSGGVWYAFHREHPVKNAGEQRVDMPAGKLFTELSYHQSVARGLYADTGIGLALHYAGSTYSESTWADHSQWSVSLNGYVSLSYYF